MPNRKEAARTQFLRGTLDLMILGSLDTLGPLHGYAIAARARYYEITAAGRRSLAAEKR